MSPMPSDAPHIPPPLRGRARVGGRPRPRITESAAIAAADERPPPARPSPSKRGPSPAAGGEESARRSPHERTRAEAVSSGKGHRDENFPVASWLIARASPADRSSPSIASCARPTTSPIMRACRRRRSCALLDRLERSLRGARTAEPDGVPLRDALLPRRLPPRHALDLLSAFRLDVTKHRYADWDDLMDYCAFRPCRSAASCSTCMARSRSTWPASDALCAALQVSTICRIAARIIATSTGSISRSMPSPRRQQPRGAGGAARLARAARLHPRLAARTAGLLRGGRALRPPDRRPCAWPWRLP